MVEFLTVHIPQTLKIECPLIHVSCLNTVSDVELYIVPFFEGETYDIVKEKGVPIIGPAAIIFLIKQEVCRCVIALLWSCLSMCIYMSF